MPSAVRRALTLAESAVEVLIDLNEGSRGQEIAKTIVGQLRALDKWAMASWGANQLLALEDGLQFKVRGSKIKAGGHVQIRLNAMDTYDVKLLRVRGTSVKEVSRVDGVYVDQLVEVLDDMIG